MQYPISTAKTRLLLAAVLVSTVALAPAAMAADKVAATKTSTTKTTTTKLPSGKTTSTVDTDTSMKRVSADKMKTYSSALANAKAKNETIKPQVAKLRQDLKTIIVSPNFDKAAFIAKSNEIENLTEQMHKNTSEATASALTQFTPEERQVLSRSMKLGDGNGKNAAKARKGKKGATKNGGKKAAGKAKKKGNKGR